MADVALHHVIFQDLVKIHEAHWLNMPTGTAW
jgi:hypothetical protein